LSQLLSKVTVASCSFYIKRSMCPHCCWTTDSKNVLVQRSSCFLFCFQNTDISQGSVATYLLL